MLRLIAVLTCFAPVSVYSLRIVCSACVAKKHTAAIARLARFCLGLRFFVGSCYGIRFPCLAAALLTVIYCGASLTKLITVRQSGPLLGLG